MSEVDRARDLLARVARAAHPPLLRSYRPEPTVAFGRLDALRPGFEAARRAARAHGFQPVTRAPGGHAAAYHEGCLVVEEIARHGDAIAGVQDRFADRAERFATALRGLGVDARVGEVPGEYCPGAYTVNARGRVKLVGTAQRVVRGAYLFASVVVVERAADVRAVLEDVYAALGLDWDPATAGGVADEKQDITVPDVERAVLQALPQPSGQ